jgi:hypothetical protein
MGMSPFVMTDGLCYRIVTGKGRAFIERTQRKTEKQLVKMKPVN